MIYIENEGAIFRGPARGLPTEIWAGGDSLNFVQYRGEIPKPVEWGHVISEAEAHALMNELRMSAG